MRYLMVGIITLAAVSSVGSQPHGSRVNIVFTAAADSFAESAREYQQLWANEGSRIVEAMERVSTLSFVYPLHADTAIRAIVIERASSSGYHNLSPMQMRAGYPLDTKRATLVHELGHRLMAGLYRRDEEEHESLFLWIYDVWIALWGKPFADAQEAVEKQRGGPYPRAWDAVTALTEGERAARWRAVLAERLPTRR